MSKKPNDILLTETYVDKTTGEEKTSYTRVGVCFSLPNGGFSGKVKEGLALTGDFIIKERKAKDDNQET